MCGIAGVIKFGNEPIKEELLSLLLCGNEHRGVDATGIVIANKNGELQVLKAPKPAWEFVCDNTYKDFIEQHLTNDTWAVLLHTRAATTGNPLINKNNHPIFAGKCAVIHNGVIHNDAHLFNSLGLKRETDTDSDIIRAMADKYGLTEKCVTKMNQMHGGAAGAILSPQEPRKMLLFKSGNPMQFASPDENFLYFASEKNTLHRACRPWVNRFGTWLQMQKPELAFAPMAEHTAWLIGEGGLIWHKEFKIHDQEYKEPDRQVYDKAHERLERWKHNKGTGVIVNIESGKEAKPMMEATCPKCQKDWMIPEGSNPNGFFCNVKKKGCGTKLIYKVKVN